MKLKPKITIFDHFCEMDDPRVERTKQQKLIDIITIAICAVICGADTWIITIFELPSYSPQLNLIEKLWRFIKYEGIEIDAYSSWKTFVASVETILREFNENYVINFV